jgi:hypothetical protein
MGRKVIALHSKVKVPPDHIILASLTDKSKVFNKKMVKKYKFTPLCPLIYFWNSF